MVASLSAVALTLSAILAVPQEPPRPPMADLASVSVSLLPPEPLGRLPRARPVPTQQVQWDPDAERRAYITNLLATAKSKEIRLYDQYGGVTSGKLARMDGQTLIVRVGRQELRVPVDYVEEAKLERDSPWDGARKGLVFGLAIWLANIAAGDPGLDTVRDSEDDIVRADTIAGIVGMTTLGFAIDYAMDRPRAIFVARVPSPGSSSASLDTRGGPSPNAPGWQVGVRLKF